MKRLKWTPGETHAWRKEVRLVYFSNLIPVPPAGPFFFWRCTSLWSLFHNPQGHDLLSSSSALTWLILFPGDRINCWSAAVATPPPPVPSFSTQHNMSTSTTHLPPPLSSTFPYSNILCKYDKCQHSFSCVSRLIASWPLLLPMTSESAVISHKWLRIFEFVERVETISQQKRKLTSSELGVK